MNTAHEHHRRERRRAAPYGTSAMIAACIAACVASGLACAAASEDVPQKSIEDARLLMGKWIETQQIIAKERNDWEQGKQILDARLKLVKDEITALEEKIAKARAAVTESTVARGATQAESDALKATVEQLATSATTWEAGIRQLLKALPEPVRLKLEPLSQRMPKDPAGSGEEGKTKPVTVAERFQNVLGILNEMNKANTEITVNSEVRTLANGKPAEGRALYIGLAQAYFVSGSGEASIGRPTADGWTWQSSNAIAGDVLTALEIIQGKHTPAFVPLPVKIQ